MNKTGAQDTSCHICFYCTQSKGPTKHISLLNNHSVASHKRHTKYMSLETTLLKGYKSNFCSGEGTKYYQNFNRTPVLTAQVKLVFFYTE